MIIQSDRVKGHLAALVTILVWGSTFVATKVLLGQFSPVEILFFRFLLGWGVLWLLRPKRFSTEGKKTEVLLAMAGLTGVTLNYLLENFALVRTQASNLAVIVSTAPLFVGLMAAFLFKQRITIHFVIGFIVSMVGIFFISFCSTVKTSSLG